MSDAPVIRVVKKKIVHATHHGGSWKVAYADFVTAMMAFFLVMWIISMDQPVREEIQSYFRDPLSTQTSPAGISKLAAGGHSPISKSVGGLTPEVSWAQLARTAEHERLNQAAEKLKSLLAQQPELGKLGKYTEINLNDSGLSIDLIEATGSLFFQSGSAELPPASVKLLGIVAGELGHLPNPVVIEGHTDVVPYQGRANYSNWELSADRANAARRVLEASGLRPHQVVEVRGYADSQLKDPRHPKSYLNRRVSILVKLVAPPDDEPGDGGSSRESGASGSFPLNIKPVEQTHAKRPF